MFGSQFFFVLKNIENIENTQFREQKQFSAVFFVFSKTVLKNSFQKQEPNKPNTFGS